MTDEEPIVDVEKAGNRRGCLIFFAIGFFIIIILLWIASCIPNASDQNNSHSAKNSTAAEGDRENTSNKGHDPRFERFKKLLADYNDLDLKRPAPIWFDCDQTESEATCISAAKNMIADWWPGAWHGNVEDQRNVAECLESNCSGSVKISGVDACAWRFVVATSFSSDLSERDSSALQQACSPLTDAEQLVARSKAVGIVNDIPSRSSDVTKALRAEAEAL